MATAARGLGRQPGDTIFDGRGGRSKLDGVVNEGAPAGRSTVHLQGAPSDGHPSVPLPIALAELGYATSCIAQDPRRL